MDVLFTFRVEDKEKQALVEEFPDCTFHFKRTASCDEVRFAEIIVTYGGNVNEEMLAKAEKLKWIMVAAAGVDQINLEKLRMGDILLTNARGIHKTPMGETILAHVLSYTRELRAVYEAQVVKEWKSSLNPTELLGSQALILGPGAIGTEVGRMLQAFGVTTIGCSRTGKRTPSMDKNIRLDQLLEELPNADFVISILPSTDETRGLLTKKHFQAMKETALFLNFGRGDVLNEQDLIAALQNKNIGHAVLDVFQEEPLPEESLFWTLENCTVSPHISAKSEQYLIRSLDIFKANLKKYLNKEEAFLNEVNLELGY